MSGGMDCNELVELVTEYLDDVIDRHQRLAFEEHLAECDGCSNYVAQIRETISLAGNLSVEDIEPAALETLMAAFRSFERHASE